MSTIRLETFDPLNGIPAFHLWERLPRSTAKSLLVMAANTAEKPIPEETVQTYLGGEPA